MRSNPLSAPPTAFILFSFTALRSSTTSNIGVPSSAIPSPRPLCAQSQSIDSSLLKLLFIPPRNVVAVFSVPSSAAARCRSVLCPTVVIVLLCLATDESNDKPIFLSGSKSVMVSSGCKL